MLSFEREILGLVANGVVARERGERLVRLDRRDLVSIHSELRALTWLGTALLLGGLAAVIAVNADALGPVAIVTALVVVALAIDAFVIRKASRVERLGVLDELLGTLAAGLLSTAVAFGESQFDWFGDRGEMHLLLLVAAHAALAYALRSRLVLGVALGTLVGWFGVALSSVESSGEFALRCGAATVSVLIWRVLHLRANAPRVMLPPFDHVAALTAGVGAVALSTSESPLDWLGLVVSLALGYALWLRGQRERSALFVVYGVVFGLVGGLAPVLTALGSPMLMSLVSLIALIGGIVTIVLTLLRWRER